MSFPEFSGRKSFEDYCKRYAFGPAPVRLNGLTIARILQDQYIVIDESDKDIAPWFITDGFWESWVSLYMVRNIKPGMKCLDIGANQGYYTLLMRKAVGESGEVYAFEANETLFKKTLVHTVPLNGYLNVYVNHAAVSARSGDTVVLHSIDGHEGGGRLTPSLTEEYTSTQTVKTVAVDDLGIGVVDFIKVDIEGSEDSFFAGARETIAKNPDIKIVMEFTPHMYADTQGFLQQIVDAGFQTYRIESDGTPQFISIYELLNHPKDSFYDLLLTKETR